jgi:dTDP-4-amino-4,6-dideoxygalactose transaminase
LTRDQLVVALAVEGIDTRNYFDPPVHRQRAYRDFRDGDLPATDAVAASVVSLPIYSALADGAVERIADAIHAAHDFADEIDASLAPAKAADAPAVSI